MGRDYVEQCTFVGKYGIPLPSKERRQILEGIEKYVKNYFAFKGWNRREGTENPLPISQQGNLLRGIDIKVGRHFYGTENEIRAGFGQVGKFGPIMSHF